MNFCKSLFLFVFILLFLSTSKSYCNDYIQGEKAKIRFLNKYTGKTELATLKIGQQYIFDKNLHVLLRACYKSSIQDDPENKAFLQVARVVKNNNQSDIIQTLSIPMPNDFKLKINKNETSNFIFSGWLLSSSPSVSYLEDKTYDITLLQCSN